MTRCTLSAAGYGTIEQLKNMNAKEFLDLVEFHQIKTCIERHEMEEARGNNGSSK